MGKMGKLTTDNVINLKSFGLHGYIGVRIEEGGEAVERDEKDGKLTTYKVINLKSFGLTFI